MLLMLIFFSQQTLNENRATFKTTNGNMNEDSS